MSYRDIRAAALIKRSFIGFINWLFVPLFGMALVTSLMVLSLGLADVVWVVVLLCIYTIALFFVSFLFQVMYFRRFTVRFDGMALHIEEGLLIHRSIAIPISALSDIIIEQDGFDRWKGLATLHLVTLANIVIPIGAIDGLSVQQAITLREQLLSAKSPEHAPVSAHAGQECDAMVG